MDYKRTYGRLPNELREVSVAFDGLDGVDGSARFSFGETKALSSVSGPIEVRLAAEQASKATFEVIVRPLSGLSGTESKVLASALRGALLPSVILTNSPRTLVQLVAQALTPVCTSTGSLFRANPAFFAALINASSLALLNAASVPMRGVVCAAAVGRLQNSGALLADPAEEERSALDGGGAFAFLVSGAKAGGDVPQPRAELVWSSWSAAPFYEDELARATELARVGAVRVWEHMREGIARVLHRPTEANMPTFIKKELDDEKNGDIMKHLQKKKG
ncbi:hypothetical protein EW145_g7715 [Phellinidium pouzarii]|uniref:Exoribonuclease phosphorolytic domain-containing protein n=1 Tax=Phellinidium pouzarii TaxID=167371 RepID=A0A4V3XA56_9AGAM|nr:hypothetical protein EW145_g7715 [Phellinidium pouzarii]